MDFYANYYKFTVREKDQIHEIYEWNVYKIKKKKKIYIKSIDKHAKFSAISLEWKLLKVLMYIVLPSRYKFTHISKDTKL